MTINSFAQKEMALVRKGNKLYNKEYYVEAEVEYKKALEKKYDLVEASFNLGDALYRQKRYDSAAKLFELSANLSDDKMFKSKSYHNLGNSYLEGFKSEKDPQTKGKKLNQSIEAYKTALKHNPKDIDTKYNLSYALKYKQQQQQQQENKKENQNKDQQDKQKQQQDKQEQQQNQKQESQQQKQELSKEDIERLLKALQNDEKEVQKKLMKKKVEVIKVKIEKEW